MKRPLPLLLGCLLVATTQLGLPLWSKELSPTQALLADQSVSPLALPPRSHAPFRTQLIVERADGIEMRRTRLSGPVTILIPNLGDWIPAARVDSSYGLHLVRFANEQISLGVTWFRKPDPALLPGEALWRYARHIIDTADQDQRIAIRSTYPPEPESRPLNILGRIPAVLDYDSVDRETQETASIRRIFLDFDNAFLVFTVKSPDNLFQANARQILGALAYASFAEE